MRQLSLLLEFQSPISLYHRAPDSEATVLRVRVPLSRKLRVKLTFSGSVLLLGKVVD